MDESYILSRFDDLVKSGVVLYDKNQETIQHVDGELKFQFLLTSVLAENPTIHSQPAQENKNVELNGDRRDGSDISTKEFEISQVSSTHFIIANKFCYARPHLMLLTSNGHRRQYEPLDETDLHAAWDVLTTMSQDYVAFYNCGQDGGCSRLHKHMQLIPKPPHSFADFLDSKDNTRPANVPFCWFYERLDAENVNPAHLIKIYTKLLAQATDIGQDLAEHADTAPLGAACPHNTILGRRWMIVIPRRQAAINKEAGANALGMLGVIAVATKPEVDSWVRLGLTESLPELGVPK